MSSPFASSTMSIPYERYPELIVDHGSTSTVAVIEGITMVVIFLGSLIANLLALTTILQDKVLRANLHNWLILNLIVNDLGFTITCMPSTIVSVFDHGLFLLHNGAVCSMSGTFALIFAFGNFSTVLAISVDRYLTVVWPIRFPPSKNRTIVFIVLCWVIPIANTIPPSTGLLSDIKYHSTSHDCTADWEHDDCLYFIICVSILFGVNVPVMIFCYIGVFRNVRGQQQRLQSYAGKKDTERNTCSIDESVRGRKNKADMSMVDVGSSREGFTSEDRPETTDIAKSSNIDEPVRRNRQLEKIEADRQETAMARPKKKNRRKHRSMQRKLTMERRIALTGTLLVMTTVACWAPYCIVNPCFIHVNVSHWLSVGTVWLAYSNTLLDPLIYSFMNRRVRARYLAMLSSLSTRCHRTTE